LLLKSVFGTPFSMSAHAADIYDDPNQTGLGPLRRKLREAEFVVTCTPTNRTYLAGLVPECASKIQTVYHGVDLGLFDGRRSPARDRLPLILSVGRLVDEKRFSVLLHACRYALNAGTELRCVIVGEGPERRELEAMRDALELRQQVQFVGALGPEKVRDWLSRADLFVLTPDTRTHYGIPNVFFEAMAMGVPVLSNRLPGIDEVLGYGVFVDTDEELCSELARLLADRPRRERLAAMARDLVEREFDAEMWADRLSDLLTDARPRLPWPLAYERGIKERAAL
jgi:glycosyltransferase involved in cell wall biosynthesis